MVSQITPYVTIEEADTILPRDTAWKSADQFRKSESLVNARLYLDSKYSIASSYRSGDAADDALKIANAKLAAADIQSSLFTTQVDQNLVKKSTKVGPLTTTKEYDVHRAATTDRFPEITALLSSAGFIKKSGSTAFLIRA